VYLRGEHALKLVEDILNTTSDKLCCSEQINMAKCLQNVIVNLKIKFFYGRRILSNFLRRYFIISHRVDAPQHNQSSAISAAYTIIEFRFKQRLFYNGLFAYRFFLTFVFEYLNKRTTNDCLNHRFTVALFVSYKPC